MFPRNNTMIPVRAQGSAQRGSAWPIRLGKMTVTTDPCAWRADRNVGVFKQGSFLPTTPVTREAHRGGRHHHSLWDKQPSIAACVFFAINAANDAVCFKPL
jgi:hypothetical protein